MRVSAARLEDVGRRLENLPVVRLVSQTVGQHELIMAVWFKDLREVQRLEQTLNILLSGVGHQRPFVSTEHRQADGSDTG
ncbi:Lrp/AsnC ligand binding domain-containing protein [Glutamicibacter sp. 2E12]|uniref:Lrp/AsnC ligand binding domain-containing protein n=1 Tax=Glutamicibacter sp. 2E12 TaxID=3416181 RepID=UPI003CEA8B7C